MYILKVLTVIDNKTVFIRRYFVYCQGSYNCLFYFNDKFHAINKYNTSYFYSNASKQYKLYENL